MAAKEMLKFGYKLGQGLKTVRHGSPALIELSNKKGRYSFGYEPTHKEIFQAFRGKKRKCAGPGMSNPYIKATFPASIEVVMPKPFKELEDEEFDLAFIIWLCSKEVFV